METLEMLGVALGLASLAGLNLYLTVLVTGLAIRMDWVNLLPQFHGLEVLGNPIIVGVAGFLFLVEFLADKVPWIDTAWDSVHTFIRPIGAAALAVAVLGDLHPVFEIVAALLAGGMALTSHVAKSGTRLVANGSPEPVSNIGLSLAEDGIVLAGLGLIAWNPIVALVVAVVATLVIVYFLPRMVRGIRAKLWLAWRKLNAPAEDDETAELARELPRSFEDVLRRSHAGSSSILWATPCLSGGGPRMVSNLRGWLVVLDGEPDYLFFIARRWTGTFLVEIEIKKALIEHRRGFLCDRVEITAGESKSRYVFVFERGLTLVAAKVASSLRENADLRIEALA